MIKIMNNQHKTLRAIFSECMQRHDHIGYFIHKLAKMAGIIGHCRSLWPTNIKVRIYCALTNSQVNYRRLVWYTTVRTIIYKLITHRTKTKTVSLQMFSTTLVPNPYFVATVSRKSPVSLTIVFFFCFFLNF